MIILPLNLEQQACVGAVYGNFVTKAAPGTGKTSVLTRRHMEMVSVHRIPATDILNLTFTAEAAQNMQERIGLSTAKENFRTFHSFALDLIMKEKAHLPFSIGDFVLPSYGQDFQLLKDLMKMYPAVTSFRSLKEKITEWKCKNIPPEQALEETYTAKKTEFFYAAAYRDYEKKCREQGWLDFSSLMEETVRLLENKPEVRARHQRKFISVDEAQDTDVVQERLLQLLYGGNIFFVGDENQLVYEWRSARAGNLDKFARDYQAQVLFLGQNYRSTPELVAFFREILPEDNGIASHMISKRPSGPKPEIVSYPSDLHEASHVLGQITDLNNTAVIARTNRQLRTIQRAAMAKGMKTMILGQKDLWQKDEVKHLLNLLKESSDQFRPAATVMTGLMEQHRLSHVYANAGNPNEKPPIENLADIIKLANNRGNAKEFLGWLRKLTYACEAAKAPGYEGRDKNPVLALTTVHQAKGREWRHVFVVGVEQGLMPHKEGEIMEERRIFFVAASRAADRLQISFGGPRSEFLDKFKEEIKIYEPDATFGKIQSAIEAAVDKASYAMPSNEQ